MKKTVFFAAVIVINAMSITPLLADGGYLKERYEAARGAVNKGADGAKKWGRHVSDVMKTEGRNWYKAYTQGRADIENIDADTAVIVFEHEFGEGDRRGFKVGDRDELRKLVWARNGSKAEVKFGGNFPIPNVAGRLDNWDQKISSLVISKQNVEVVLYAGVNFDGDSRTFNTVGEHQMPGDFNDKARSIVIRSKK